jgi:hypothetical protein
MIVAAILPTAPWHFKHAHKERCMRRVSLVAVVAVWGAFVSDSRPLFAQANQPSEFRVLATNKTSTMEKELNEAGAVGFRFHAVMGGDTAVGGSEVVTIVARNGEPKPRFSYKLLATTRTSTMEKELQQAGDEGYQYRGQTVFKSAFGGEEVVCILERDNDAHVGRFRYKLLATTKTSTLQKELHEAGAAGYELLGMTVAKTAIGGNEIVAITRRPAVQ